jgi:hypothetical protein
VGRRKTCTVSGHELEFVDEFDAGDEEGQGFATSCPGSGKNIPWEIKKNKSNIQRCSQSSRCD